MERSPIIFTKNLEHRLRPEQLELLSIAQGFLHERFPLSPNGQQLRNTVSTALDSSNWSVIETLAAQLPTVENPHIELFQEIDLTESEREKYFGIDCVNIQTTKGCTRQCSFCTVGADLLRKKDIMPFPAIVQFGKFKREEDQHVTQLVLELEKRYLTDLGNENRAQWTPQNIAGKIKAFQKQWLQQALYSDTFPNNPRLMSIFLGKINKQERTMFMTNYYDSDPFDYVSKSFRHSNGSPAHYGDVFSALATPQRPIQITTAGWLMSNQHAQAAARSICSTVLHNPQLLDKLRISINPTDIVAQKNLATYREQMEDVIRLLAPLKPEVMFIYNFDRSSNFHHEVVSPLQDIINDLQEDYRGIRSAVSWQRSSIRFDKNHVSSFSRKDSSQEGTSNHDVAACLPGYHIWPDGTVHFQKYGSGSFGVDSGDRPQPINRRLYVSS